MPKLKTYNIFISHSWKYSDDYERLVALLNHAPYFSWRNYSVPSTKPVLAPDEEGSVRVLSKELQEQIQSVSVVLVVSGMYVAHKFWIQCELELASAFPKPIIGIIPQGNERVPEDLQTMAVEMVRWNTDSIVSAIRKHSL